MGVKANNFGKTLIDKHVGFRGELKFPDYFTPSKLISYGESEYRIDEDHFGYSVAVDGDLAVVGVPDYDDGFNGFSSAGAVMVYRRTFDAWEFAYAITTDGITDPEEMHFGFSVSLKDGLLAVGAPLKDFGNTNVNPITDAGGVFLFDITDTTSTHLTTLFPATRTANDGFGTSVTVMQNLVYVSSYKHSYNEAEQLDAVEAGAVWAFSRNGNIWTQVKKITAAGNERNAEDQFGTSIASHKDIMVVGVPNYDYSGKGQDQLNDAGAAYIWEWSVDHWRYKTLITAEDRAAGDQFGFSVSVYDGVIAVGAPGHNNQGKAYTFGLNDVGRYVLTAEVEPTTLALPPAYTQPSGANYLSGSRFGAAVSLNADTLVVGAPRQQGLNIATTNTGVSPYTWTGSAQTDTGYIYVYDLEDDQTLTFNAKFTAAERFGVAVNRDAGQFGFSVSAGTDIIAVGEPFASLGATGKDSKSAAGLAHAYTRSGGVWSFSHSFEALYNDRNVDDNFAAAHSTGDRFMVITAPQHDYDANGENFSTNAGAAYVWELVAGAWVFRQKLAASDRADGLLFGSNAVVDGDRIFISAPGSNNRGAVYIYHFIDGTFVQTQKIVPTGLINGNNFGSVIVAKDSKLFVASTNFGVVLTVGGTGEHGTVFAYALDAVTDQYVGEQRIVPSTQKRVGSLFGSSIAYNQNVLVVGAPNHDLDNADGNSLSGSGASFVFALTSNVWSQISKISGPGEDRAINNYSGFSVATWGNQMAVGVPFSDTGGTGNIADAGQVFIYEYVADTWALQASLVSPNRQSGGYFGYQVAISENRVAISAPGEGVRLGNWGEGAVYTFDKALGSWTNKGYIAPGYDYTSHLGTVGPRFGYSMAMDPDSLIIVAGAPNDCFDQFGGTRLIGSGAAYAYEPYANGQYHAVARFTQEPLTGRKANAVFGTSVDIKGSLIVIGAPGDSTNSENGSPLGQAGSTNVWRRTEDANGSVSYNAETKLAGWIDDRNADDNFGTAIVAYENTVIISSPNHDYDENSKNYVSNAGAVFVYEWENRTLVYKQKLVAFGNDRKTGMGYGTSMAMNATHIAIAAPQWDTTPYGDTVAGRQVGKVWTYKKTNGAWIKETVFQTPQIDEGLSTNAAWDTRFGYAMAMDNLVLVIGSPGSTVKLDGSAPLANSGMVTIYRYNVDHWELETSLQPQWRETGDQFGIAVEIRDGILVVGGVAATSSSPTDSDDGKSNNGGAAWIYTYAAGIWTYSNKITRGAIERFTDDNFGSAASLDGNTLVIGAPNHVYDANGITAVNDAGAAYVFTRADNFWQFSRKISAPVRGVSELFGTDVTVKGDTIWVGAPGTLIGGVKTGAVYGFTRNTANGGTYKVRKTARYAATGASQNFVVPDGITSITAYIFGAAGNAAVQVQGGNGGFARAKIPTVPGETLTINVGKRPTVAGGGGGRSEIMRSTSTLAVAGGGGGFNAAGFANFQGFAGSGGDTIGEAGYTGSNEVLPGLGGTASIGGAARNYPGYTFGASGDNKIGGDAPWSADFNSDGATQVLGGWPNGGKGTFKNNAYGYGGGGDGWFGGSAGALLNGATHAAPGGGGSSYLAPGVTGFTQTIKSDLDEHYGVLLGEGLTARPGIAADGYVYLEWFVEYTHDDWVFSQRLDYPKPVQITANMGFGSTVEFDGATLLVTSNGDRYNSAGTYVTQQIGSVSVFEFNGFDYELTAMLSPFGTNAQLANNAFGNAMSVYDDIIAVGSSLMDYDELGIDSKGNAGQVFVFRRINGVWTEAQRINPPGNARKAGDLMGYAVSHESDWVAIGAPGQDYNAGNNVRRDDAGAVYMFKWVSGALVYKQKLAAPNATRLSNGKFGQRISLNSDELIVAAPGSTIAPLAAGYVYVFTVTDDVWSVAQTIAKPVSMSSSLQWAADISKTSDASRLAVGATLAGTSTSATGRVAMFNKVDGQYVFDQEVAPTGTNATTAGDGFGSVLALVDDFLIVGAPGHQWDQNGANSKTAAGASWFFQLETGVWVQKQKIVAWGHDLVDGDLAGSQIVNSGAMIAVSSPGHAYDRDGNNYLAGAGAVYIWRFDTSWILEQKITAPVRATNAGFGNAIALSSTLLVVGAPTQASNNNTNAGTGAAFVFEKTTGDTDPFCWSTGEELIATGTNAMVNGDLFGTAVAIINGDQVVVGAPGNDYDAAGANSLSGAGAVYTFRKFSTWTFDQKLVTGTSHLGTTVSSGRFTLQDFGRTIAASALDLIVGAPTRSQDARNQSSVSNAGIAVAFSRTDASLPWTQTMYLSGKSLTPDSGTRIGTATAGEGDYFAIGAAGNSYDANEDNFLLGAGAVYIWHWDGSAWQYMQKLTGPAGTGYARNANANYGASVAMSGTRIVVGSPNTTIDGNGSVGLVAVYDLNVDHFELTQVIKPDVSALSTKNIRFGWSVDYDGTTIIVGAPTHNVTGQEVGRTYVYEESLGSFALVFNYTDTLVQIARYGSSVSVKDGVAVSGAPNDNSNSGAAQVFVKTAGTWGFSDRIYSQRPVMEASARFGTSVGIYGAYMAVGAPNHSFTPLNRPLSLAGAVFLFENVAGTWIFRQKIAPTSTNGYNSNDQFGTSVDFTDGVLTVGSPMHTYNNAGSAVVGTQFGAIYQFEQDVDGYFYQTAKISPAGYNATTGANQFGLSHLKQGKWLIVGAPQHAYGNSSGDGTVSTGGAAFVYKKVAGVWTYVTKLFPQGTNGRVNGLLFGTNMAFSGGYVVVGTPLSDYDEFGQNQVTDSGTVWVYQVQALDDLTVSFVGGGCTSEATASVTPDTDQTFLNTAITSGGTAYTSHPEVVFSLDSFTGYAKLTPTTVASVAFTAYQPTNFPTTVSVVNDPRDTTGSGAAVQIQYSGTAIASVTVNTPGSGYQDVPTVTASSGTGVVLDAILAPTTVSSLTLTSTGSGFTAFPNVLIDSASAGGVTATGSLTMQIDTVAINATDTSYVGEQFQLAMSPTNSTFTVSTVNGTQQVTGLTITNTGEFSSMSGYTGKLLTKVNTTVSNGLITDVTSPTQVASGLITDGTISVTTRRGLIRASTLTINITGKGKNLTLLTPGSGYRRRPAVSFSVAGPAATATITPTTVQSVNVTNGGTGVTVGTTLSFSGGSPVTAATATANLGASTIIGITLTNAGSNYTRLPQVVFSDSLNFAASLKLTPTTVASVTMLTQDDTLTNAGRAVFRKRIAEPVSLRRENQKFGTAIDGYSDIIAIGAPTSAVSTDNTVTNNNEAGAVVVYQYAKTDETFADKILVNGWLDASSVKSQIDGGWSIGMWFTTTSLQRSTNMGTLLAVKNSIATDRPNYFPVQLLTGTSTSTTYTIPANVTSINCDVWGYGDATRYGEFNSLRDIPVTPGDTMTLSISGAAAKIQRNGTQIITASPLFSTTVKPNPFGSTQWNGAYGMLSGTGAVVMYPSTDNINKHIVRITNDGAVWMGSTSGSAMVGTTSALSDSWNHMLYTFNAGVAKTYINGALVGSTSVSTTTDANAVVSLGAAFSEFQTASLDVPVTNSYVGYMADITVWSEALSGTDAAAIITNGSQTVQSAFIKAQWAKKN